MRIDSRIKYIMHKKNRGLFQARVSGAEEAAGDYIAFLDSDDYVSNDFYSLMATKAVETDADITVCNTVFVDIDGSRSVRMLYKLCFQEEELFGENIRNKFFEQEGACFSWHTVWNKLYSMKLWKKCEKYYQKQTKHLIMTEDIAFSSLLLYNAEHLVKEFNAHYFYCKHAEASTFSENIGIEKFSKNVGDMKCAFDFVENYLTSVKASPKIMDHFMEFRKKYSRMWRTLQIIKFPNIKTAEKLVNDFLPGYHAEQNPDEFCFDVIQSSFEDTIDYFKSQISDKKIKYVSFDIFDTLILRPFYDPTDLFDFMEHDFERLTNNSCNISFKKMRTLSENYARRAMSLSSNAEDIRLTEIYDEMKRRFEINGDIIEKLKALENEYELRFCVERKTGKELFKYALRTGKKIYLTSDMYLEADVVTKILEKNGYTGYEKLLLSSSERRLKNGSLYKTLIHSVKDKPETILHIGDNWAVDKVAAERFGINTIFIPKAGEVFENKISGLVTNNCAWTEKYIMGPMVNYEDCRKNLGYRTMLALVRNKFFDNPYDSFNEKSDFNSDPYMIGYYLVGMHCVGIARWIIEQSAVNGYKDIYFLARDGYLPMQVFNIVNSASSGIKAHYIHGSRRLTMPFMVNSKNDLFDLPIERNNHTPESICNLLSFCSKIEPDHINDYLSDQKFAHDITFGTDEKYIGFMSFFADNLFDEAKLRESQRTLSQYYSQLGENSAVFDMGYSGRIQGAISEAAGRGIDVFFIHKDSTKCDTMQRKHGFKVHTFYDVVPASTGIMREYILSDISPACNNITTSDKGIELEFEKDTTKFPEKFIIRMIQKGAIDFASDFVRIFGNFADEISIVPQLVSAPFEYFLRFSKKADRDIFSLCKFEDRFYGNISSVSADRLFNNQLCDIKPYSLPSDYTELNRVELDISVNDDDKAEMEISYSSDIDETEICDTEKDIKKILKYSMFIDKIDKDDTTEDKFSKCINDTSYIVCWNGISSILSPEPIMNWFMTNPGGFEPNDFDAYIINNLSAIKENQDLTFLDKVLKKIGDKLLLPITIGLSGSSMTSDFSFTPESLKTLSAIAERCNSIGVNGEYTAEILNKAGIKNIRVVGCPSLYVDMKVSSLVNNDSAAVKKLSASFRPFGTKLTKEEEDLLIYFAANKFRLVETSKDGIEEKLTSGAAVFDKIKGLEASKSIFFDVPSWKTYLTGYDFAMGTNFQSNVMAIRAGVRALFINYETGGAELCKFFELPSIELSQFDSGKTVMDYYRMADYSKFRKALSKNYAEFKAFLEENGIFVDDIDSLIIEK